MAPSYSLPISAAAFFHFSRLGSHQEPSFFLFPLSHPSRSFSSHSLSCLCLTSREFLSFCPMSFCPAYIGSEAPPCPIPLQKPWTSVLTPDKDDLFTYVHNCTSEYFVNVETLSPTLSCTQIYRKRHWPPDCHAQVRSLLARANVTFSQEKKKDRPQGDEGETRGKMERQDGRLRKKWEPESYRRKK